MDVDALTEIGVPDVRTAFWPKPVELSIQTLFAASMWAAYFDDPEFALDVLQKAHNIDATAITVTLRHRGFRSAWLLSNTSLALFAIPKIQQYLHHRISEYR